MRRLRSVPKAILTVVFVSVALAGFLSPYLPEDQNRSLPLAAPTRVYLLDENNVPTRPFVYRVVESPSESGRYIEDRSSRHKVRFFVQGAAYEFLGISVTIHLFGVDAPASIFLTGTDEFGRDLFSRLLHGGRRSLFVGPLAALLALCLGLLIGGAGGFFGGRTDEAVMAAAELFLCFPWLYLLFGLRALLPLRLESGEAVVAVVTILALAGWARPARLVRGVVLSAKELDYVSAARGFGASEWYLLRKHILPQTRSIMLAHATLLIPSYILAEATLSYVGLGISEPNLSWGSLMVALQRYDIMFFSWWMWLPAMCLIVVTGCFYALTDRLSYKKEKNPPLV